MGKSANGRFIFGGKLYTTLVTKLTDYYNKPRQKVGVFYALNKNNYLQIIKRMIKATVHTNRSRHYSSMDNNYSFNGSSVCTDETDKRPCKLIATR